MNSGSFCSDSVLVRGSFGVLQHFCWSFSCDNSYSCSFLLLITFTPLHYGSSSSCVQLL